MNKQIEGMANDLAKICPDLVENCCGQVNCVTHLTLSLSKLGYRKSTDVAREIFEEADKIFMATCLSIETYKAWVELKKKYESEGAE